MKKTVLLVSAFLVAMTAQAYARDKADPGMMGKKEEVRKKAEDRKEVRGDARDEIKEKRKAGRQRIKERRHVRRDAARQRKAMRKRL